MRTDHSPHFRSRTNSSSFDTHTVALDSSCAVVPVDSHYTNLRTNSKIPELVERLQQKCVKLEIIARRIDQKIILYSGDFEVRRLLQAEFERLFPNELREKITFFYYSKIEDLTDRPNLHLFMTHSEFANQLKGKGVDVLFTHNHGALVRDSWKRIAESIESAKTSLKGLDCFLDFEAVLDREKMSAVWRQCRTRELFYAKPLLKLLGALLTYLANHFGEKGCGPVAPISLILLFSERADEGLARFLSEDTEADFPPGVIRKVAKIAELGQLSSEDRYSVGITNSCRVKAVLEGRPQLQLHGFKRSFDIPDGKINELMEVLPSMPTIPEEPCLPELSVEGGRQQVVFAPPIITNNRSPGRRQLTSAGGQVVSRPSATGGSPVTCSGSHALFPPVRKPDRADLSRCRRLLPV